MSNYCDVLRFRSLQRMLAAFALGALCAPSYAASDNCLAVNGIGNRPTSAILQATYTGSTDTSGNTTFTYTFFGLDPDTGSSGGVPGLISYCVYPAGGNLPTGGILVDAAAVGTNGNLFDAKMAAKGSFSFTRNAGGGNSSNIPFDGTNRTMGTAKWNGKCIIDLITSVTVCTTTATDKQTILLHINDQGECDKLYGAGGSNTCWVFPTTLVNGPPPLCNGEPACKSAVIDEATGAFDVNLYPIVPLNKLLHIHYTYVIVNQPTNTYNMAFNPPTSKTQDVNSGGGKDYFGCEQVPDDSGSPGAWGTFSPYQATPFKLTFFSSPGTNCSQSRFTMVAPGPAAITLMPGQSYSFTVDMQTRVNKGGKQEFTSAGPHILNSGFTVKWIQSDDKLLHSFTTGITPLYVNAQP